MDGQRKTKCSPFLMKQSISTQPPTTEKAFCGIKSTKILVSISLEQLLQNSPLVIDFRLLRAIFTTENNQLTQVQKAFTPRPEISQLRNHLKMSIKCKWIVIRPVKILETHEAKVEEMFDNTDEGGETANKAEIMALLKQSKYKVRPNSSRVRSNVILIKKGHKSPSLAKRTWKLKRRFRGMQPRSFLGR